MSGAQNGSIRDTTGANSAVETAAPPPLQVTRILRRQTWIRAKKMRFLYVLLVLPVVLLLYGSGDSGAAQDCRDGARPRRPNGGTLQRAAIGGSISPKCATWR